MLKVGDTVKVISDTVSHWDPEEKTQYIPIGTICTVTEVENGRDGTPYYGITPLGRDYMFCYLEDELEKGHMEWIKDKEVGKIVDGVTTCCGYDFGVDFPEAKYCPICGRKLMKDETEEYKGYILREVNGVKYPFKPRPYDDADYYYAGSGDGKRWTIYFKGKYHYSINGNFYDIVDQLERLNQNINPKMIYN